MNAVNKPQITSDPDFHLRVLRDVLVERGPHRTLVLSGQPERLAGAGVMAPCCVRLNTGKKVIWSRVDCAPDLLPFSLDVFDLVVLHERVDQRDEHLLASVRRCMPSGAQLLIMGSARFSARNLLRREPQAVALQPEWLQRRLRELSFTVEDVSGKGLIGQPWNIGRGWRRGLLAMADHVVIRARRGGGRADIRLVRFARPGTAALPAASDGFNRQASS